MLNGYCDEKLEKSVVDMLSYFVVIEEKWNLCFDFLWVICVLMVKILVGICNIVCEDEEKSWVL